MKKKYALFLLTAFFGFQQLNAQNKAEPERYLAERGGGLCDQSLLLFNDSSYCTEWGCEASSYFSFGKWTQKKDIISFIPADPANYSFVTKIESEKTVDKKLTVVFFDKDEINITEKIKAGQYDQGKGFQYSLDLDSSKTKRTDYIRPNSLIRLVTIQQSFNKNIEIRRDSLNLFKIHLNISGQWNFHSNSTWGDTGTFSLIKKNDRLLSLHPDHLDDKGKLVPTEFIRQEP